MNALTINVIGTPAPQGSKRAFVVNGRAVMAESSKKVKPWRQDVAAAVAEVLTIEDWWAIPPGPVRVDITYYLPRPRYHYRSGKHADQLKPTAPTYVDKKPDKDKLDRATYDALTASGVIRDDAQIAAGDTVKRYADAATGARITITPLTAAPAPDPMQESGAARPGTPATPGGTREVPGHPQTAPAPTSTPGAGATPGTPAEGEANGVPGTHVTPTGALF